MKSCVILVGHGGVPTDCPPALVSDFKRLEAQAKGKLTPELLAADAKLRAWPRTPKTDPYQSGLEEIARALQTKLAQPVLPAYNEFCAPSVEQAIADAVRAGAKEISLISTMYTRGGIHSEREIPEIVARLQQEYPTVKLSYRWPFDVNGVADFLALELKRC